MVRTKIKPKLKRTIKPKEIVIKHHFGGHLPFPPKDCELLKYSFVYQNVRWIDLALCISCKQYKECENRNKWVSEMKKAREEKLRLKKEGK